MNGSEMATFSYPQMPIYAGEDVWHRGSRFEFERPTDNGLSCSSYFKDKPKLTQKCPKCQFPKSPREKFEECAASASAPLALLFLHSLSSWLIN
jgi:hypothetical protein